MPALADCLALLTHGIGTSVDVCASVAGSGVVVDVDEHCITQKMGELYARTSFTLL